MQIGQFELFVVCTLDRLLMAVSLLSWHSVLRGWSLSLSHGRRRCSLVRGDDQLQSLLSAFIQPSISQSKPHVLHRSSSAGVPSLYTVGLSPSGGTKLSSPPFPSSKRPIGNGADTRIPRRRPLTRTAAGRADAVVSDPPFSFC